MLQLWEKISLCEGMIRKETWQLHTQLRGNDVNHDDNIFHQVLVYGTLWYTTRAYVLRVNCGLQYVGEKI